MSTLYLKGIEQTFLGNIDFDTDTIKLDYMSTSYTPSATTESFLSDVSASIASGAPTVTLANVAVNIDTGNSRVEIDADDVSTGSITTTTNKFIIYKDTGSASTSPLIGCFDIAEGTLSPVNDDLSLTFNAEGIFSISAT